MVKKLCPCLKLIYLLTNIILVSLSTAFPQASLKFTDIWESGLEVGGVVEDGIISPLKSRLLLNRVF